VKLTISKASTGVQGDDEETKQAAEKQVINKVTEYNISNIASIYAAKPKSKAMVQQMRARELSQLGSTKPATQNRSTAVLGQPNTRKTNLGRSIYRDPVVKVDRVQRSIEYCPSVDKGWKVDETSDSGFNTITREPGNRPEGVQQVKGGLLPMIGSHGYLDPMKTPRQKSSSTNRSSRGTPR